MQKSTNRQPLERHWWGEEGQLLSPCLHKEEHPLEKHAFTQLAGITLHSKLLFKLQKASKSVLNTVWWRYAFQGYQISMPKSFRMPKAACWIAAGIQELDKSDAELILIRYTAFYSKVCKWLHCMRFFYNKSSKGMHLYSGKKVGKFPRSQFWPYKS